MSAAKGQQVREGAGHGARSVAIPSSRSGGNAHVQEAALAVSAGSEFQLLVKEVRACTMCADVLPFGPRPVFQASPTATLLIASQAPGTRVHASGIPFSDASGDRLREWTGLSHEQFYDAARVAILPMGLCYPGRARNGDAPPRPECAPLWRDRLLAAMPALRLVLLVGSYAQTYALGPGAMTQRVRDFRSYLPNVFPLPHPSWRSRIWSDQNPWFAAEVLPVLRQAVGRALDLIDRNGEIRETATAAIVT